MSSLTSGTRKVIEFGKYGPSRVLFEATDALGRTITAHGQLDDGFIFTGYTDHTVVWSLIKWDWSDVTHWGDNQEFCAAGKFRQLARGDIAPGEI